MIITNETENNNYRNELANKLDTMLKKNSPAAETLATALRIFAENPDRIDNFENYLSYHFDTWMETFVKNDPDNLAAELLHFANIE